MADSERHWIIREGRGGRLIAEGPRIPRDPESGEREVVVVAKPAHLPKDERERVKELEAAFWRILTEKSVHNYDGPLGKNYEENPLSGADCRGIARTALHREDG